MGKVLYYSGKFYSGKGFIYSGKSYIEKVLCYITVKKNLKVQWKKYYITVEKVTVDKLYITVEKFVYTVETWNMN